MMVTHIVIQLLNEVVELIKIECCMENGHDLLTL